jgi:hypothetical protein
MSRTPKENGIVEGKILTRLDSIDEKIAELKVVVNQVQCNQLEIARLKTFYKIILPLLSIIMGVVGYLIGN